MCARVRATRRAENHRCTKGMVDSNISFSYFQSDSCISLSAAIVLRSVAIAAVLVVIGI